MLLDGLYERFDLEGNVRLGKVGVSLAVVHAWVPGCRAYQVPDVYFLIDDLALAER